MQIGTTTYRSKGLNLKAFLKETPYRDEITSIGIE
jgi:hypothetical protein